MATAKLSFEGCFHVSYNYEIRSCVRRAITLNLIGEDNHLLCP